MVPTTATGNRRGGAERLKSMIRLKEEEPPIPAEGMTEAVFSQRLGQWNEAVMAGLHRERKVIPNLYQPRVEAEQELKGWIEAAPLLVIAAEVEWQDQSAGRDGSAVRRT